MNRNRLLALLVLLLSGSCFVPEPAAGAEFPQARPGYTWNFPRDHGSHPGYKTEWWYFTGELRSDERQFGYQFTIFRRRLSTEPVVGKSPWSTDQVLSAHLALSDLQGEDYYRDYFSSRGVPGLSASDTTVPGTIALRTVRLELADSWTLRAKAKDFSLDLNLIPKEPPLFHGEQGFSRKGPEPGQASYYYSFPRMQSLGTVSVNGETFPVEGRTWFDHEFGSSQLNRNQVGWDWLSLRLRDDRDLMLFRIREEDGGLSEESALTLRNGDTTTTGSLREQATFRPRPESGRWTSPETGVTYPLEWVLRLHDTGRKYIVEPAMNNQEMILPGNGLPPYWEGLVRARTPDGTVVGRGYLELTGYGGSVANSF